MQGVGEARQRQVHAVFFSNPFVRVKPVQRVVLRVANFFNKE